MVTPAASHLQTCRRTFLHLSPYLYTPAAVHFFYKRRRCDAAEAARCSKTTIIRPLIIDAVEKISSMITPEHRRHRRANGQLLSRRSSTRRQSYSVRRTRSTKGGVERGRSDVVGDQDALPERTDGIVGRTPCPGGRSSELPLHRRSF